MNRETRRKNNKKDKTQKKRYSLQDVQKAMNIAIEMKKHSKGHLFSKTMVNKKQESLCVFCGQTMKTKKECDYWVMTLLDRMQTILINPSFFMDDNIEALWLQHGEEYQNIQLPLNVGPKP